MEATHDDIVATRAQTRHSTEDAPAPPSLWRSVLLAFRQAQLARLEARLQRMRQSVSCPPTSHEHPVILVSAESVQYEDVAGLPLTTTRPPRRWAMGVIVGLLILTAISLNVVLLRSRVMTADALPPPPPESPMPSVVRETTELRALLTRLDDRVTVLQHQVMQHGDQLTNQTTTVLSVSQHADTQETQLTSLADAVTTLTAQMAHVEKTIGTQATQLAAQEQHLTVQAVQLDALRAQTRNVGGVSPRAVTGHSRQPRPPTLEVFAPPSSQTVTPVPQPAASLPATGTPPARRSITLPAALGAVGYRTATGTTEGIHP